MDEIKTKRGKAELKLRHEGIDKILLRNQCIIDWKPNSKGHLLVLMFKDGRETIYKQFGKKPYNIYKKVHMFYDFIEETFAKKAE
jgi:hypothetical protein